MGGWRALICYLTTSPGAQLAGGDFPPRKVAEADAINTYATSMSRGSWRSAEALYKRQVERRAIQRADDRARLKRERETEEWHITGEPAFKPKERSYPHGGGVEGAAQFLSAAERAMHLYDR